MPILVERVVTGLAMIGLLAVIYFAARAGTADLFAEKARVEVESWEGTFANDPSGWEEAYIALSVAVSLEPRSPDYQHRLGNLHELRRLRQIRDSRTIEKDQRLALERYRESVRLRPVWAVAWGYLASVKAELGEVDQEYLDALHLAAKLGPWEPSVQLHVVRAGFSTWGQLDGEYQELVRDAAIRGMKSRSLRQPDRMAKLLRKFGKLAMVCAFLPRDELTVNLCRNR